MTHLIQPKNSVEQVSFKQIVQQNLQTRKVSIISTGAATTLLSAAAVITGFLSASVSSIAALAILAFAGLVHFLQTLFSPSEKLKKTQIKTIELPSQLPATGPERPLASAKQELFSQKIISYIKAHPYKSAAIGLGLAATGAGLYYAIYGGAGVPGLPGSPTDVKGVSETLKMIAPSSPIPSTAPIIDPIPAPTIPLPANTTQIPTPSQTIPSSKPFSNISSTPWYENLLGYVWGNAKANREKGLAELAKAGTSLEQLDAELQNVPRITIEKLKETYGSQQGVAASRELYKTLDQKCVDLLQTAPHSNLSCEAQAKFASDCRNVNKFYTREIQGIWSSVGSYLRNLWAYGTEPDYLYFRGYKNCSQIIGSAAKTNTFFDTAAKALG